MLAVLACYECPPGHLTDWSNSCRSLAMGTEPLILDVDVTHEDIANGRAWNCLQCPVALAVMRALYKARPDHVWSVHAAIDHEDDRWEHPIRIQYDRAYEGEPVEPENLDLDGTELVAFVDERAFHVDHYDVEDWMNEFDCWMGKVERYAAGMIPDPGPGPGPISFRLVCFDRDYFGARAEYVNYRGPEKVAV